MKKITITLLAIIVIQLSYIGYKTSDNNAMLHSLAKDSCDKGYDGMCKYLDK